MGARGAAPFGSTLNRGIAVMFPDADRTAWVYTMNCTLRIMMLLEVYLALLISYHHPCATRIAGIARGAFELWLLFSTRLGTANAGLAPCHVLFALLLVFMASSPSFLHNGSRSGEWL